MRMCVDERKLLKLSIALLERLTIRSVCLAMRFVCCVIIFNDVSDPEAIYAQVLIFDRNGRAFGLALCVCV